MRIAARRLFLGALLAGCYGAGTEPPESDAILKWRNVDVRGESIPAVDGIAVYNLEQETHILSAVRKTDGVLLWKRTLPVSMPSFDGYGLALSGGVLVVGDLDLFGVDPATGEILWQYHPSEGRRPGYSRLTETGGVVYCGSTSGHIFAVEVATGAERWVSRAAPDTSSSVYWPVVVDGVVYAGFTHFSQSAPPRGGAVAVNAVNGQVIWSVYSPVSPLTSTTENTAGTPVVGNKVFVGSATGIHVVDRNNGTLLSKLELPFFGDAGPTPHRPFLVGGLVLGVSGHGSVTAIDPVSLQRKWQVPTTSSVLSITGSGSVAYIPSFGRLIAVNVADGTIRWTFMSKSVGASGEHFLAAPAFDDKALYLPGSRAIYAFTK